MSMNGRRATELGTSSMTIESTMPPPIPAIPRSGEKTEFSRRHDLDALRAAAMLLGIVYHAALSFAAGLPWMVQDVSQSQLCYLFQAFVHGFRMQLFFVVSGFFTAMLWRSKGLKSLLWHRFRRVFLPCMVGLFTVVPAMAWASGYAMQSGAKQRATQSSEQSATASIWGAIRKGDHLALVEHLRKPDQLEAQHPEYGTTPLTWAALVGQREMVADLLASGANVNAHNRDGGTALHAAAFLGRAEIVGLLLEKGADPKALSGTGDSPAKSAVVDMGIVEAIAGYLGIPVDRQNIEAGRKLVLENLGSAGAGLSADGRVSSQVNQPATNTAIRGIFRALVDTPVFILIWFLWFLVWLLAIFTGYAGFAEVVGWSSRNLKFLLSAGRYLWLIPLTAIPQWFMGFGNGEFGPDTSMGIIPMPHVLAYYAIFFFFGALYFDSNDETCALGSSWRWLLPATLLVVFPLGLEFATGRFGWRDQLVPRQYHHVVAALFQAAYAWLMTIGSMGMFRSLLTRENRTIRYLSDSSYWMYLAHLPLVIAAQALIRNWAIPAIPKLILFSGIMTVFLLFTYQVFVRYTWIGLFLNGRRYRQKVVKAGAMGA